MKLNNKSTLFILSMILISCTGEQETSDTQVEEVVRTVNVRTEMVETSDFASYLRLVGTVETSDDIQISAEVSGQLMEYFVREGEKVKKDQVIGKIDDTKNLQIKAQLQAASEQAKENYERLKKIYEEDQIGSEINYLNAKYVYEQAQAQLNSIEVDLGATELVAPFDGEVETFLIEEGEIAIAGSPVFRLIGSDNFIIAAGVPARYANVVGANDNVDIWFDTQDSDTLKGSITYVANSINPQNRTFRVEVLLPKGAANYKVDMIANMKLQTRLEEQVIVISEEFIYRDNDDYIVYVSSTDENGNDIAIKKRVELGASYKTRVIIQDGLNIGDELITLGSAFLNEGMRIQIFEEAVEAVASQR